MSYHQITAAERYTLALLRRQGRTHAAIARMLGRHRSTIGREFRRNAKRYDGRHRADVAHWYATGRRARSRCNQRFGRDTWDLVRARLAEQWSPEQIAGWLAVDQPRDHLSLHLGRPRARRRAVHAAPRRAEATAQALRPL